jgi:hypothetical protein
VSARYNDERVFSLDLDPLSFLISTVVSGVGLVLLVYGRKQQRWPHMVAGALFLIYPYFVGSVPALLGMGALVALGLWALIRLGY